MTTFNLNKETHRHIKYLLKIIYVRLQCDKKKLAIRSSLKV